MLWFCGSCQGLAPSSDATILGYVCMALPALIASEPSKRDGLITVVVDTKEISSYVCATLALFVAKQRTLTTSRMLARLQSLLRRVVATVPSESLQGFNVPPDVAIAAEAYVELSRLGGPTLCKGLTASAANLVQ